MRRIELRQSYAPPKRKIIIDAFVAITWLFDASKFEDQWICDESWLRILKRYFPLLKNEIDMCQSDLVRALSTISITSGDTQNKIVVFQKMFTMDCPWSPGERRHVNFFYRSTNGIPPPDSSNSLVCNYANRESLPSTHYSQMLLWEGLMLMKPN